MFREGKQREKKQKEGSFARREMEESLQSAETFLETIWRQ